MVYSASSGAECEQKKVRRVCNCDSSFTCVSRNDILVVGPELLQCLIRNIFRVKGCQIAMTTEVEAIFPRYTLQTATC